MRNSQVFLATGAFVLMAALAASAATIETVPVGNTGNVGELSGSGAGGFGADRVCGAVSYTYSIAKYEVTAGQYTEFLNAVAGVDTYSLYNTSMWSDSYGCKIERHAGSGTAGDPYQYRVGNDWADRPVNYVSWGDSARFCNWLHNGQPTGAQDSATTEDGAYYLNGATSDSALMAVNREADWKWATPTEDEWYKAAYHKNDGDTGNYFDFATGSDSTPSNAVLTPDGGNNANFDNAIGSPYYRTKVGEFELSESPYGTFDQSGNVWEWTETSLYSAFRLFRGGTFTSGEDHLVAAYRNVIQPPTFEHYQCGLRVAAVPEPATMVLLGLGGVAMFRRRRS